MKDIKSRIVKASLSYLFIGLLLSFSLFAQTPPSDFTTDMFDEAMNRALKDISTVQSKTTSTISTKKHIIFTGGVPGSGKTTALNEVIFSNTTGLKKDQFVFVDADEYKKYLAQAYTAKTGKTIPDIGQLHPYSKKIQQTVLQKALASKVNIVLDGTMGGMDNVEQALNIVKSNKTVYEGTYVNVEVSQKEALKRVHERFLKTGRNVSLDDMNWYFKNRSKAVTALKSAGQGEMNFIEIDNNGSTPKIVSKSKISMSSLPLLSLMLADTALTLLDKNRNPFARPIGYNCEDAKKKLHQVFCKPRGLSISVYATLWDNEIRNYECTVAVDVWERGNGACCVKYHYFQHHYNLEKDLEKFYVPGKTVDTDGYIIFNSEDVIVRDYGKFKRFVKTLNEQSCRDDSKDVLWEDNLLAPDAEDCRIS